VKVKSLNRVRLLATPWKAAYQAPPSIGFSRQEYWSGVPLPSPGTLYTEGQTDEALSCLQMTENLAGKKVKTSDKNRVAQMVKNLLAMWETEEPGVLQSMGLQSQMRLSH